MKLTDFPVKTRGKFHTQNGKFFREIHEGVWQQIECYLPCAEGTYGEPIVVTAERFLVRLNKGEMKPKRAIGKSSSLGTKYALCDGVLKVQDMHEWG